MYILTITYTFDPSYICKPFETEVEAVQMLNKFLEKEICTIKNEDGYEPTVIRSSATDVTLIYSKEREKNNRQDEAYYRILEVDEREPSSVLELEKKNAREENHGIIKYHQHGVGPEYGEDHALTNNWDPEKDYGNDYARVYFRMEAKGYQYPSFSFSEEDGAAFDKELISVFSELGWTCSESSYHGRCATWTKGKSNLYLHPQNFSGEVLKNEIKTVAEAIRKKDTFRLRWVELYETIYDMTDESYKEYLQSKKVEIKRALFKNCHTTRRNLYHQKFQVAMQLARRFRLHRIALIDIEDTWEEQTIKYIAQVMDEMVADGFLVLTKASYGQDLVRSINKTEQRERKISPESM